VTKDLSKSTMISKHRSYLPIRISNSLKLLTVFEAFLFGIKVEKSEVLQVFCNELLCTVAYDDWTFCKYEFF